MALTIDSPSGVALAADFVNSWDEYPTPRDLLGADWLRRWLTTYGLASATPAIGETEVARARTLRTSLTRSFDAGSKAEAVAILNGLVADLGTPPQLERQNGRWYFRAWPQPPTLDTAVALGAPACSR